MTTEADLVTALSGRYPPNEYAVVPQVRDGAGWDRRTADAIAIGLWHSRGHTIHGFEAKVSRADWKREKERPEKAEAVARFCDYWWMVAPPQVVGVAELPDTWGLLEYRGGKLHMVKQATKLDPAPLTPGFVAQVLKRALTKMPGTLELQTAFEKGRDEGLASKRDADSYRAQHAERELSLLRERVKEFEAASGISLERDAWRVREYAYVIKSALANTDHSKARVQLHQMRVAALRLLVATDDLQAPETVTGTPGIQYDVSAEQLTKARAAVDAMKPIEPHWYSPDYQAMGDCKECGWQKDDQPMHLKPELAPARDLGLVPGGS